MTERKLYATYRYPQQVGPEDWKMVPRIREIQPQTTVSELVEWFGSGPLCFEVVEEDKR